VEITCPNCQTLLEIAEVVDASVTCPECGVEITFEPEDPPLDALRVRQLAAARRAAYRVRSYCLIAALFCIVAAMQFLWNGVRYFHSSNFSLRTLGYFALMFLSGWGGIYFLRRAKALLAEAKATPTSPDA
jgi:hypothetical protein